MKVRKMLSEDIESITKIYLECFHGMKEFDTAKDWIRIKYNGYPINRYYVIEDDIIKGYILWIELGGFRKEAVLELEQIAISPKYQGRGLGSFLIKESLKDVNKDIIARGSTIKLVKVTTGTDNKAQRLYIKTLNAKPIAVIPDLFRGDEVILIARKNDLDLS
jgi:ribosomal protein S18 acetylase RimI-like enzyme